jgi:hypothetical protein
MSETKLIPLDDYNNFSWLQARENLKGPVFNGLACPKCKHELVDKEPYVVKDRWPAQKEIFCSNCTYEGHRFL